MAWERLFECNCGGQYNSRSVPDGLGYAIDLPQAQLDTGKYRYKVKISGHYGGYHGGGNQLKAQVVTHRVVNRKSVSAYWYGKNGYTVSEQGHWSYKHVAFWHNDNYDSGGECQPGAEKTTEVNVNKEVFLNIPSDQTHIILMADRGSASYNSEYNSVTITLYREIKNANPAITGSDADLGARNDAFEITYQISDADSADQLTATEKLNGSVIRTLSNAPRNEVLTIPISREKLFNLALNTQNTIEISVDDGKGGVSYRRYTFKRTNSAPQISGEDQDLGKKNETFSVTFSATDQENDEMSAKVYLNDKLLKTIDILPSAEEQTYDISKLEFVQLNNMDAHKIRIEVQDKNAATSIRNFTFRRLVGHIFYQLIKETDQMAKQIIISPTWFVAEGAVAKVEVANNAKDIAPTWENATEQILQERQFNFTNQNKTAELWAIGVRITIAKGTATDISWLAGFGGAYK